MTLDPESSTDLDQAMHLERTDAGYRVLYAIAEMFILTLNSKFLK